MPLLLRRLAGDVAAPLRRSLCTAAAASPPTLPQWSMLFKEPALDASGPPSPDARASLARHEDLWAQISVPAHLVAPDATGAVRAATPDGLLLLDFSDTRRRAPVDGAFRHSWLAELGGAGLGIGGDVVARFVCNPLTGQLVRLPLPAPGVEGAARTSTAAGGCFTGFGLLTQSSESSGGPPDRYAVAQLTRSRRGGADRDRPVVRRFLSETGEWDERQLVGPSTVPAGRLMRIDPNHEVVAFGDRLWWLDPAWGVCSVDPFSDQPEHRFVELPPGSVLPDLGRHRRLGVSEGKLRYTEVSNIRKPFVCSSFSLDHNGCSWTLEHRVAFSPILPESFKLVEDTIPRTAAIAPSHANYLFLVYGHLLLVVDMAKGESLGGRYLPQSVVRQIQTLRPSGLFVPCMLPPWLESTDIPCAGTLSSKKTNSKRNTLADTLVRANRGQEI